MLIVKFLPLIFALSALSIYIPGYIYHLFFYTRPVWCDYCAAGSISDLYPSLPIFSLAILIMIIYGIELLKSKLKNPSQKKPIAEPLKKN